MNSARLLLVPKIVVMPVSRILGGGVLVFTSSSGGGGGSFRAKTFRSTLGLKGLLALVLLSFTPALVPIARARPPARRKNFFSPHFLFFYYTLLGVPLPSDFL